MVLLKYVHCKVCFSLGQYQNVNGRTLCSQHTQYTQYNRCALVCWSWQRSTGQIWSPAHHRRTQPVTLSHTPGVTLALTVDLNMHYFLPYALFNNSSPFLSSILVIHSDIFSHNVYSHLLFETILQSSIVSYFSIWLAYVISLRDQRSILMHCDPQQYFTTSVFCFWNHHVLGLHVCTSVYKFFTIKMWTLHAF